MVVVELLKNDVTVRGLGHPVIFSAGPSSGRGELEGRVAAIARKTTEDGGAAEFTGNTANFQRFGAVMVTPRNFYRLMQTGQNALLFPGGVREVFHGRGEAYQLSGQKRWTLFALPPDSMPPSFHSVRLEWQIPSILLLTRDKSKIFLLSVRGLSRLPKM